MERLPAPPMPDWLEQQLPFERSMVRVEDHWLHVMTLGRKESTPVLMLHGNPTWGYLYRNVTRNLAGAPIYAIMPDLVGLGFSSKPQDPAVHQLAAHGRWISALIDALGLERLVLVIQDWGGPIGLRALADRPDRLAGLVVLNTVVGPPKPGFKPTLFHRLSQTPVISDLVFRDLGFPQSVMHMAQGNPLSLGPQARRAYAYPLEGKARNVAPLAMARMVPDTLEHPSIPDLARCQQLIESYSGPCAIVWGDRDPILGSVRRHIQRLLPHARVTRTQGGHFLQEEHPDKIADAVRWVIRQVK